MGDNLTNIRELKEEVKDSVLEAVNDYITSNEVTDLDDINYNGAIDEIVDGCVPIYNHDIMECANDPEVWSHVGELGPAFDGSPTLINITAGNIYEILSNEAHQYVYELAKELPTCDMCGRLEPEEYGFYEVENDSYCEACHTELMEAKEAEESEKTV